MQDAVLGDRVLGGGAAAAGGSQRLVHGVFPVHEAVETHHHVAGLREQAEESTGRVSLEPLPSIVTAAASKLTSHLDSWATNFASASFSMVASVRMEGYGGSRHPLIMADFRETRKNLRGRQRSLTQPGQAAPQLPHAEGASLNVGQSPKMSLLSYGDSGLQSLSSRREMGEAGDGHPSPQGSQFHPPGPSEVTSPSQQHAERLGDAS